MSQYEGMDTVHSRACLHRACPHWKCVGGDPGKNAADFFQELRVRKFNHWVREQRRKDGAAPMHFFCGTRHRRETPCTR